MFDFFPDIQEFYELTLLDETKSVQEKTAETIRIANKWETSDGPIASYTNNDVSKFNFLIYAIRKTRLCIHCLCLLEITILLPPSLRLYHFVCETVPCNAARGINVLYKSQSSKQHKD